MMQAVVQVDLLWCHPTSVYKPIVDGNILPYIMQMELWPQLDDPCRDHGHADDASEAWVFVSFIIGRHYTSHGAGNGLSSVCDVWRL